MADVAALDPTLPDDPRVLQALVQQLRSRVAEGEQHIARLTHQLHVHLRARFGRKSERLTEGQLQLFLAELAVTGQTEVDDQAPVPPPDAPRRRGRPHGRRPLAAHLPRERVVHTVPEADRTCPGCQQAMPQIGEELSEQLEYRPACFVVLEHVRAKYACRRCGEAVVTAEKPPQPIEKGLPGPGLLAQVVTAKYADHAPLWRQVGQYRRHGVDLAPATLGDWITASAELLGPLVAHMKRVVLASDCIQTDDTKVPVLDVARESVRTGYCWAYLGDAAHPCTTFDFSPSRQQEWPRAYLAGFTGRLQADAYKGYDQLFTDGRVIEVGCLAHARRYFFDAQETDLARALSAMAFIRVCYDVERDATAAGATPAERQALRQARAKPILDQFGEWLAVQARTVLPKSPIAEAITYARNQWTALNRYCEDGRLDIDNNAAERALRGVVLGRKNYLFVGSDEGGRRAAIHYSVVATCKRHDVDPFAYLRDVLARLPTHPASRIDELLPHHWKAARAAADSS